MQIHSVRATRDSVSGTDQIKAPHEKTVSVVAKRTAEELLIDCFRQLKHLDPAYTKGTWAVTSQRPIAVISDQWRGPRMLMRSVRRMEDILIVRDQAVYMHFCLYANQSPEDVYRALDTLSFPYLPES